jgi:hypothetical protein
MTPTSLPSLAVWPVGLAVMEAWAYQKPPPMIATPAANAANNKPRRWDVVECVEDMLIWRRQCLEMQLFRASGTAPAVAPD